MARARGASDSKVSIRGEVVAEGAWIFHLAVKEQRVVVTSGDE